MFFLIVPVYAKQIDFSATVDYSMIEICKGSTFIDKISLFNSNDIPLLFTLTKTGDAARWSTIMPDSFVLEPYSSISVEDFLTVPLSAEGSYDLNIEINADNNIKKILEQTIIVKSCNNIEATIKDNGFSNCPCSPTEYSFKITNTGDFTETVDLFADIKKKYYTISEQTLTLAPKESETVFLYVTMPCDIYGDFWFNLKVDSRRSEQIITIPFFLNLRPECYDYDLRLGKAVLIGNMSYSNTTVEVSFEESNTDEYTFCVEEDYVIPIAIINNGEIDNNYLFTLDKNIIKDGLLELFTERLFVENNSSELNYMFINSAAHDLGIFPFIFTIETENGKVSKTYDINIYIEDCMNVSFPKEDEEDIYIDNTITNTANTTEDEGNKTQIPTESGESKNKIKIILLWLLLILILIFLLFGIIYLLWEKEDTEKERIEKISALEAGKAEKKLEKEKAREAREKEKEEKKKATEQAKAEKEKEKSEIKKEKAQKLNEKEKNTSPWKIFIIILVILLILLAIFLIWKFWPAGWFASPYYDNATNNNITNATVINIPIDMINVTDITVNQTNATQELLNNLSSTTLTDITTANATAARWTRWFNFPAIWKDITSSSQLTMTTVPKKAKQNITIEAVNEPKGEGFISKFFDLFSWTKKDEIKPADEALKNISTNVSNGNITANLTIQTNLNVTLTDETAKEKGLFSRFIDMFIWWKKAPAGSVSAVNTTMPTNATETINATLQSLTYPNPVIDLDDMGSGSQAFKKAGETSRFIVNEKEHTITIKWIANDSIIFEIRSDVKSFKAKIGERIEFDSDNDGLFDTIIIYKGIMNESSIFYYEKKGYKTDKTENASKKNTTIIESNTIGMQINATEAISNITANITEKYENITIPKNETGTQAATDKISLLSRIYIFIRLYLWYIFIGIIILLFILLLFNYLDSGRAKRKKRKDEKEKKRLIALLEEKRKNKEKEKYELAEKRKRIAEAKAAAKLAKAEKYRPTKEEKKQKTVTQFLVVLFILLLLLLMVLFVYTGTLKKFGINVNNGHNQTITDINKTLIVNETIASIQKIEPLKENSTTYIWNKNTQKIIDLNKLVLDKDNDKMKFISTEVNNISVMIKDGVVTLVPEKNWHGIRYINFIADDGNGRAYSPDIMLVVNNKGSWYVEYYNNLKSFFSEYLAHMVLVMLIIIIGTTIFVLNMRARKIREERSAEEKKRKRSKK
jgi:Flp pilus assembly protein TadB